MVRTVKSHNEEEDEDDDEFLSRANDGSSHKGGKSSDQKVNANRSKHSETEQRRRSKINERFQILRDLIPQNDQKRDKASFLLEVIQYIQFLQEKLQMYEGTYQGWSLEQPTKLMPWKNNCGPLEGLIDQSQLEKNGSLHEDNIVVTPALLNNAQHSIESDLSGPATYEATDHQNALNIPLQPNLFEGVPAQPQGSFSDALHMASQSQSRFWHGRPCTTECSLPKYNSIEHEELRMRSEEASISNSYSQELLNNLSHALKSSGVDVSQASISVQLDIAKQTNSGINSTVFRPKDHVNPPPGNQAIAHYAGGSSGEDGGQPHKRLRTEQS
ncbi:hypothetical protein LguiB_009062 [Lonicera macranthoides]